MVDVLLGLQWGDEGKGKVVDYLAERYDVVARFQGGPNAGHTLVLGDKKYILHTIPSGVFRAGVHNIIGNGVVIDPITLWREIQNLQTAGIEFLDRLFIARKAHLILPSHRLLDAVQEASKGSSKIGSTLRGIGPAYTDKVGRQGLRIGDIFSPRFVEKYNQLKATHLQMAAAFPAVQFDLATEEEKWMQCIEQLRRLQFINSEYFTADALANGKRILAEGAQGSMLDIDFGTYPFVTSSNTVTAGVCSGLGIAPQRIGEVYGITKAYCTRVGGGPFPTELHGELGEQIRQLGGEFGATTGRARRCGWLDVPQLRYTILLNGVTQLIMTKADVLETLDEIAIATAYQYEGQTSLELPYDMVETPIQPVLKTYAGWKQSLAGTRRFEDFPAALQTYINDLEQLLGVPFSMISIGPEREQLILK